MDKTPCSVAILTYNNADTIEKCLQSVAFADDIVILDGGSLDDTRAIAQKYTDRIYDQHEPGTVEKKITNFTQMREKSFALTKHDWVIYIDSDEWLSSELQKAIDTHVEENNIHTIAQFNRIAVIDDKKIKHAYYYPDFVDRLFHKKSGVHLKKGNTVHERMIAPETVKRVKLNGELFSHWPDLASCIQKDDYYQDLSLQKLKKTAHKKDIAQFIVGGWTNTLRALKVFISACYINLTKKNALPFAYHMRFVRYNLKHAWSIKKWKIMCKEAILRIPKPLKTLLWIGFSLRILMMLTILFTQGQNGFVYTTNGDAVEYVNIAHNLVNRGIFSDQLSAPFPPQSWRTPGLPFVLVALGGAWGWFTPTILLQIITSTLLILMVFYTTRELLGKTPAYIATALTALEPNMVYWPSQILTETLFMVMLFATIQLFLKWMKHPEGPLFALGMVMLTLTTYMRQASFFLLFVIPLFALGWIVVKKMSFKKTIPAILVGIITSISLLFPWYYRNHNAFGVWTFDLQFAGKGSIGKYLEAYTLEKHGTKPIEHFKSDLVDAQGKVDYTKQGPLAVRTFLSDPLPFIKLTVLAGIPFLASDGWYTIITTVNPQFTRATFDKSWTGSVGQLNELFQQYIQSGAMIFLLAKALYAMIGLLGIIGAIRALWKATPEKRTQIIFLLMIVAYAWVASGLGSYARFRYPFQPFIFMFTGFAISWLIHSKKKYA